MILWLPAALFQSEVFEAVNQCTICDRFSTKKCKDSASKDSKFICLPSSLKIFWWHPLFWYFVCCRWRHHRYIRYIHTHSRDHFLVPLLLKYIYVFNDKFQGGRGRAGHNPCIDISHLGAISDQGLGRWGSGIRKSHFSNLEMEAGECQKPFEAKIEQTFQLGNIW